MKVGCGGANHRGRKRKNRKAVSPQRAQRTQRKNGNTETLKY
jgi:hypothetical protein